MGYGEVGTESVVLLLQNLHFTARESFLPKIVETREKSSGHFKGMEYIFSKKIHSKPKDL